MGIQRGKKWQEEEENERKGIDKYSDGKVRIDTGGAEPDRKGPGKE